MSTNYQLHHIHTYNYLTYCLCLARSLSFSLFLLICSLLISQIRIRVGEYDFSHVQEQLPYIERAVSKKVVHPKYNFFTYEYDLALVKLEQPLEFAPHVSPICLPETESLLIGMNATVTGWGRLSEGGTLPSVLQEVSKHATLAVIFSHSHSMQVSVPIVSNDNCKSMFLRAGRQEFIPDIFLCAGYETGGQDSCQGDSGGPLQVLLHILINYIAVLKSIS